MQVNRGDRVVVYVEDRHDFQRRATVLRVDADEVLVRYDNGETELVPSHWIR